jgi:hypothetical protein
MLAAHNRVGALVTSTSFGKRSSKHISNSGLRDIAPTHAKPLHASPARKFERSHPAARVEGRAEQLFARMLDIHPEVEVYEPQGIGADLVAGTLLYTREQRDAAKERYRDSPGISYYTADYNVRFASRKGVYEVKDERYTSDRASEERFERARSIFMRHGYAVSRVVIPGELHPIWNNVNLVHKLAHRTDVPDQLVGRLQALEGRDVGVAREALNVIGASLNELPALIAMGVLAVDLFDGRIRAGMRAVLAHGTLDHLRLIERLER